MGVYAYCQSCNCAMDAPMLREVLKRKQPCTHCGKLRDLSETERDAAVDELVDRVEALEREKEMRDVMG